MNKLFLLALLVVAIGVASATYGIYKPTFHRKGGRGGDSSSDSSSSGGKHGGRGGNSSSDSSGNGGKHRGRGSSSRGRDSSSSSSSERFSGPRSYWAQWSSWSDCTQNCGTGTQSRWRQCVGTGRGGCRGSRDENRKCNTHLCPSVYY